MKINCALYLEKIKDIFLGAKSQVACDCKTFYQPTTLHSIMAKKKKAAKKSKKTAKKRK